MRHPVLVRMVETGRKIDLCCHERTRILCGYSSSHPVHHLFAMYVARWQYALDALGFVTTLPRYPPRPYAYRVVALKKVMITDDNYELTEK